MNAPVLVETALLLTCPVADAVVGPRRARLDRAARVGVPAHVTVLYPFVPSPSAEELARLVAVAAGVPAFTLTFSSTAWFDEHVVFLAPDDPSPVAGLTEAVVAAFPDFPPYGGAFEEVVPHLTIGHDHPVDQLRAAEQGVLPHLPLTQEVTALELWSGPPLLSEEPGWRRVASYPLG